MVTRTAPATIEQVLVAYRTDGASCISELRAQHPDWVFSLDEWMRRTGGRDHVHTRMGVLAKAFLTKTGEAIDPVEMCAFLYYGLYFSLVDLLLFFQEHAVGYRQFSSIKAHFTRCFGWQLRDRYNNPSPVLVQKFNRRATPTQIPDTIDLPERLNKLRASMVGRIEAPLPDRFDVVSYNTITSRSRKIRSLLVAVGAIASIAEADEYISALYRGGASAGDILTVLRWVVVKARETYPDIDTSIVSMSVGHFHSTFLYARRRRVPRGSGRRGRPRSILRA